MSTLAGGRVFSTSGDTMSTSVDIMSTSGDVQYIRDIMMHVGEHIKAVTSCSTHKIDQQETMVKILKYNNPYHKIKLKIRQILVLGKSTGQINN